MIFMEDTPKGTEIVTTYTGTIEYQASKSGAATAKHRTLASAGASARALGAGCGS